MEITSVFSRQVWRIQMTNLSLESIASLLKHAQRELDDVMWDNQSDPRIEGLVKQIEEYKERLEQGEIYEPKF